MNVQVRHHRPFHTGEQARPHQARNHLGQQPGRPVVAQGRRVGLVCGRLDEQPAVPGPRGRCQQHQHIARYQAQGRQLVPVAPGQHGQHARGGQRHAPPLLARDGGTKKQPPHAQHEDGHAGAHQRHVQRGGCFQRHVLQRVVTAHAQQPQQGHAPPMRPQRATWLDHPNRQRQQKRKAHHPAQQVEGDGGHLGRHQAAHHGVAGPEQGRDGQQQGGAEAQTGGHGKWQMVRRANVRQNPSVRCRPGAGAYWLL